MKRHVKSAFMQTGMAEDRVSKITLPAGQQTFGPYLRPTAAFIDGDHTHTVTSPSTCENRTLCAPSVSFLFVFHRPLRVRSCRGEIPGEMEEITAYLRVTICTLDSRQDGQSGYPNEY